MESAYTQQYPLLFEKHWWWRARRVLILDEIARIFPRGSSAKMLDVGCVNGLFFDDLLQFGSVYGIEPDPLSVSPDGRHTWRIHVGGFDRGFRPSVSFDAILMLDVLEHFSNPVEVLTHATSLLTKGGRLVLTVPAFRALWTQHDVINHHYTRYTKKTLQEVLAVAGFRARRIYYFFHWMFPAKLCARGMERLFRSKPEVPAIPTPWLNRSFYALCRLEQQALRPLNLPFGTSIFAVAEPVTDAP